MDLLAWLGGYFIVWKAIEFGVEEWRKIDGGLGPYLHERRKRIARERREGYKDKRADRLKGSRSAQDRSAGGAAVKASGDSTAGGSLHTSHHNRSGQLGDTRVVSARAPGRVELGGALDDERGGHARPRWWGGLIDGLRNLLGPSKHRDAIPDDDDGRQTVI